jgi:hypothetical protein
MAKYKYTPIRRVPLSRLREPIKIRIVSIIINPLYDFTNINVEQMLYVTVHNNTMRDTARSMRHEISSAVKKQIRKDLLCKS